MLQHSVPPRAYLVPLAMNTSFDGYYKDQHHLQSYYSSQPMTINSPPPLTSSLAWQIGPNDDDNHVVAIPSPLDLSLKPPPGSGKIIARRLSINNNNNDDDDENDDANDWESRSAPIVVDDDEDRRSREEAACINRQSPESTTNNSNSSGRSYCSPRFEEGEEQQHQQQQRTVIVADDDEENEVIVDDDDDDDDELRSCTSSVNSGYHQPQQSSPIMGAISYQEAEQLRLAQEITSSSSSSSPSSLVSYHPSSDYHLHHHHHHHHSKLLLSPSTNYQLQNYHQLLQTPQHHHHHHHHQHLQGTHALTPPSTPSPPQCQPLPPPPQLKRKEPYFAIPVSPVSSTSNNNNNNNNNNNTPKSDKRPKKKHARKLKFDEDKSSPVSGTVIIGDDEADDIQPIVSGDIDPIHNIVNVSPEARAELAKIENKIGAYQCMLCRQLHDDAFKLAQHRCSRIRNVDYRCTECEKRFSCPANLASHRRWHKPRPKNNNNVNNKDVAVDDADRQFCCNYCDARFGKQSALKKHITSQHKNDEHDNNNDRTTGKRSRLENDDNDESAMEVD